MTDNTNSSRKEAQNGSTVAVERSTEGKATELHSTVSVNGDPFTFEYKVKSINGKFSGSINKDKLGKEISRKGIFTNLQNRKFYEGELKENTPHGKGKLFSADGSTYEGDFREGKMKGFGKYTYLNGSIYEGEFLNDQYNGRGKLIQANGDIYKGEFRDGEKNGKGKMIYKNGAILEGNFANGKLEENKISSVDFGKGRGSYEINSGKMTYKFPEGESFEAPFKNGSIEGPVKYNDETIEVEFGEKTGWSTVDGEKGICVNKKGDLFIGKLNANKNGPFEGILLERNGTTLEGVFNENGLLTSGKITQANGSYKWGKFDANGKLRKDCEYYKKKVEENDTITETSRAGDGSKRIFQFDGSGVQRCYRFDKDSNPIGRDTLLDGPETYGEGKERAGQINFEKIDTNTKKLSGVKFNKDGFSEGPVTYYSYDANGKPGKPVKIDYDKLNRALSEGKN
ncbi:MAG: hypothetical protein LBI70_02645, partial [Rickettsiales bacterium]|nr:hypothetical protein [Rickettsiales bacterium]